MLRGCVQRARRWCAEGVPKASPSAPVSVPEAARTMYAARATLQGKLLLIYSHERLLTLRPCPCQPPAGWDTLFQFSRLCPHCCYSVSSGDACHNDGKKGNLVRAALINTHSLSKHYQEIFDLLTDDQLDLLFITETWLNESSNPVVQMSITEGFKISHYDRQTGRGRGIAVIYRDKWTLNRGENVQLGEGKFLDFNINISPQSTFGGTLVYRPPRPAGSFLKALEDVIVPRALRFARYLFLGDLNLHLDQAEVGTTQEFEDSLALAQLIQWVRFPTHRVRHILDSICSNFPVVVEDPLPVSWSDHSLVYFSWPMEGKGRITQTSINSVAAKVDPLAFTQALEKLRPVLTPNLEGALACFTRWITSAMDSISRPLCRRRVRESPSKP